MAWGGEVARPLLSAASSVGGGSRLIRPGMGRTDVGRLSRLWCGEQTLPREARSILCPVKCGTPSRLQQPAALLSPVLLLSPQPQTCRRPGREPARAGDRDTWLGPAVHFPPAGVGGAALSVVKVTAGRRNSFLLCKTVPFQMLEGQKSPSQEDRKEESPSARGGGSQPGWSGQVLPARCWVDVLPEPGFPDGRAAERGVCSGSTELATTARPARTRSEAPGAGLWCSSGFLGS